MPSKKSKNIQWFGAGDLQNGDLLYYQNGDWIRLPIGPSSYALRFGELGQPPIWESQITSSYLWYEPGNSWFLGSGPEGVIYYKTDGYEGTDPSELPNQTWIAINGSEPIPTLSWDGSKITVSGSGSIEVNGEYSSIGVYNGSSFFNSEITNSISSSSSSLIVQGLGKLVFILNPEDVFSSSSSSSSLTIQELRRLSLLINPES
jgi:hypothetical protein